MLLVLKGPSFHWYSHKLCLTVLKEPDFSVNKMNTFVANQISLACHSMQLDSTPESPEL